MPKNCLPLITYKNMKLGYSGGISLSIYRYNWSTCTWLFNEGVRPRNLKETMITATLRQRLDAY